MNRNELDALRLHLVKGLGRAKLMRLLRTFGDPEAILEADPRDWQRLAGVESHFAEAVPRPHDPLVCSWVGKLEQQEVRILTCLDADYPAQLHTIIDPPALLYLRGKLSTSPSLAVVGARKASEFGRRWTRSLCRDLALAGVPVISGLARGIDTAAHHGCLDGDGQTLAILGCGIDQVYPPENAELAKRIVVSGALLSEYPPGAEPLAGHFPGRNRLISALSTGVLVVEAATGSGSLITADFALEQGREVFAVPGNPLSATSSGTNQLLKDGAHLVTEALDIIDVILPGQTLARDRDALDFIPKNLSDNEKKLFKSLTFEPLHIDELSRKSALTPMEVSDILLHLELAGWIEQLPGTRYLRSRTHK